MLVDDMFIRSLRVADSFADTRYAQLAQAV